MGRQSAYTLGRTEPETLLGNRAMSEPHPIVKSTRLFRNGNSQAVRIPKALAFDSVDIEVEIERRGDELIVRPASRPLTGLGAALRKLAPHFRGFVREQPIQDERDWAAPPRARGEPRGRRNP